MFSLHDHEAALAHLLALNPVPPSVDIVLVPEHWSSFDDWPSPLHLHLHDLCHVCALQLVSGEGMTLDQYHTALNAFASELSKVDMSMVIHCLQTANMRPEEWKLCCMMRWNLPCLLNWPE